LTPEQVRHAHDLLTRPNGAVAAVGYCLVLAGITAAAGIQIIDNGIEGALLGAIAALIGPFVTAIRARLTALARDVETVVPSGAMRMAAR
jgi:hypothetical protein